GAVVDLPMRVLDQVAVPEELPVAETPDQRGRADREREQDEEQAAPRIRSTGHGSFLSLAGGDDEGRPELAEARVERLLADCRLACPPLPLGPGGPGGPPGAGRGRR